MNWNCAACGEENKPKYRFCVGCGAPRDLPGDPAGATAPVGPEPGGHPAPPVSPVPETRAVPAPEPTIAGRQTGADETPGWRCHECWRHNAESDRRCSYCGTSRRSSARADRFDAFGGLFSKVGKAPFVFLALLAVAAGLGALYWYLNPKHAEEIPAPAGLEAAVRADLAAVSPRQVDSIRYYNCYRTTVGDRRELGGYAVRAAFAPRSTNLANRAADGPDTNRFHHFIAHRSGYEWRLERFPADSAESAGDPCVR